MNALFDRVEASLLLAFQKIETHIPKPQLLTKGGFQFFRTEKTLEAALVLKVAHLLTALHSSRALLVDVMAVELGALWRTIGECGADILFLSHPLLADMPPTELHRKYLDEFFQEQFGDPKKILGTSAKRHRVPRHKIHAYNSRIPENPLNQSDYQLTMGTIDDALSGYVHGAAVHILDLYNGYSPKDAQFHLHGVKGTPMEEAMMRQAIREFHNAIMYTSYATMAFKDHLASEMVMNLLTNFESHTGIAWKDVEIEKMIRQMR